MSGKTVTYRLTADISGFRAGLAQASASAKKFAADVTANTDQAEKFRTGLDHVGTTAGRIGLVAAAGLGAAVVTAANFDQAMSKVQAATGETAENMDRLREAAIDAGASTAFSATEAAAAIENLSKAGVSTSDILSGGLAGALDLAAAGELQVADAAEIAASALTQFGLAGADVPHVADLLAAGAGKAQGEVTDLAGALNQSGLVAAQMGLSLEETVGGLSAFASAGLLGSDAGTSFKTMLLGLVPQTEAQGKMFDQLGFSAFDAQGNFVGLEETAGRLRAALDGMTDEQRAATLKSMFGQDAIRAASILYEQGADGIQSWIAKVDDSGYAAEQAAAKLDNLKGDVEAFTGALETALIGTGEGAQGPLRTLVQLATAVINVYNNMPGPVQAATGALLGFTAVAGGGIWTASKIVQFAADSRQALSDLGITATNVKGMLGGWSAAGIGSGLGGLALGLGAVGAAFTAATALVVAWAQRQAESAARVQALSAEIDAQTGALSENGAAMVANNIKDSGWVEYAQEMGISLDKVTLAATGNVDAFGEIRSQLSGAAGEWTSYNGVVSYANSEADEMLDNLRGQSDELGRAREEAGLYASAEAAVAGAMGETAGSADTTTTSLSSMREQLLQAGFSAEDLDRAAGDSTGGIEGMGDAASDAAGPFGDLLTAMRSVREEASLVGRAEIAYEAAIDAATEAVKRNGSVHDINTEKGRANMSALYDLRDAWANLGEEAQNAPGAWKRIQQTFQQMAIDMGHNKKEAGELADRLLDIPSKKTTEVEMDGAEQAAEDAKKASQAIKDVPGGKLSRLGVAGAEKALTQAGQVTTAVKKIPDAESKITTEGGSQAVSELGKTKRAADTVPKNTVARIGTAGIGKAIEEATSVTTATKRIPKNTTANVSVVGADAGVSSIRNLQGSINSLTGKTVTVTTIHRTVRPGGTPQAFAGGGLVLGAGSATSDSIPAWLSNREYVLPAWFTRMVGPQRLDAALAARSLRPLLAAPLAAPLAFAGAARFASGGYVTASSSAARTPVAVTVAAARDAELLAAVRELSADVRRSARASGAEFGRRMNGILDDAARSAW